MLCNLTCSFSCFLTVSDNSPNVKGIYLVILYLNMNVIMAQGHNKSC